MSPMPDAPPVQQEGQLVTGRFEDRDVGEEDGPVMTATTPLRSNMLAPLRAFKSGTPAILESYRGA